MRHKWRWTRLFGTPRELRDVTGPRLSNTYPIDRHSRQYGDVSVSGHGLTVIGDVYNNGTLLGQRREVESSGKFGLCLGAAPQIDLEYFIGRATELHAMAQNLKPGSTPTEQRRLILGGMGGVGKTQLAVTYAKRHHQYYNSVFWLNATSEPTLEASFRLLAARLVKAQDLARMDFEQVLAHVHEWLSNTRNTQWLLIFDNYDDPNEFAISKYCPYAAHGSIIITTRVPDLVHISSHQIRVQPLGGIEESLEILRTRSQRENVAEDQYAYRLTKRLDGLPLALATAGAYLRKSPSMTFQQYLQMYDQRWKVDHRRPLQLQDYHRDQSLYTTWNLSYTRLQTDDPLAAQTLKLLAYFDNQDIWYELLNAGYSEKLPIWLQELSSERTDFESVMRTLVDYSLVQVQPETQSYSIHNCVHDWTLAELNKVVEPQLYWYAVRCVAASVNQEHDYGFIGQLEYARLIRHAVRCVDSHFSRIPPIENRKSRRVDDIVILARLLTDHVRYSAAEQLYDRALAACAKTFGPEDEFTLTMIHNLGLLYRKQDRLVEAEQMYLRALAGKEKTLGPDHTSTLTTVHNLAVLYLSQGKPEEAEKMCTRAANRYNKVLGPDHIQTLETRHVLATLYAIQGRLNEAEAMYQGVSTGYQKVLGGEHTSMIMLVVNLGSLYRRQGKLVESEQMYRHAMVGYRKKVGDQHFWTRGVVDQLAALYREQGRLREADALYR